MTVFDNGHRRFPEWLRNKREDLKLTEEEFAERLDVVIATVLMWEVGNTSWAVIS